jgi:hypothetical protein
MHTNWKTHNYICITKELNHIYIFLQESGNLTVCFLILKQCIWSPNCCSQEEDDTEIDITGESLEAFETNNEAFGFTVKEAVLFPPEVEKGMWPENYSLSDHAPLTVVFSPTRMPCSPRIPGEL